MATNVRFNDINEVWRVRRILEMWNPANDDLVPWRDDLVKRLLVQLDALERLERVKANIEVGDRLTSIIEGAADENNVIAPDPQTKLYQILFATDLLVKALVVHFTNCESFKRIVKENGDFTKCDGCVDNKACKHTHELMKLLGIELKAK